MFVRAAIQQEWPKAAWATTQLAGLLPRHSLDVFTSKSTTATKEYNDTRLIWRVTDRNFVEQLKKRRVTQDFSWPTNGQPGLLVNSSRDKL